jgi:hypothetical protein
MGMLMHQLARATEGVVRPTDEGAAPHQARRRDRVEAGVPHAGEGRLGAVAPRDREVAGAHAVADAYRV